MSLVGYLDAVPAGQKEPRSKSWCSGLPEVGELQYLWSWFTEIFSQGSVLACAEIQSWSEMTMTPVSPDEFRALRELAIIYSSNYELGKDPDSFPPWMPEF